jgi:transposase
MISLAPGTKVFLACRPIDLRAGFNGLVAKVQQVIGQSPFDGSLFISGALRPHSALSPERDLPLVWHSTRCARGTLASLAREGLELDRSTLSDWVGQAAWLLDPVVAGIRKHVFAAEKIHGDDTTVPVLEPGLGRTKTGRLWVYVRDDRPFRGEAPPAAAYFYSPDRSAKHPTAHMAAFTGFLQADGYAGFEALYDPARTKPGPITEVACLARQGRKMGTPANCTRACAPS